MCRSISAGNGGICTFGDCLGNFLAVGPDGSIYPCQRFVGLPKYSMGNVKNVPSDEELQRSKVWQMFQARQERVKEECGDCSFFNFCKGGCPYNALVAGHGHFRSMKDPNCIAYNNFFAQITDRALNEVFSEENLKDVTEQLDRKKGLMRKGKLLTIMNGGSHPSDSTRNARRILVSVALASLNSPEQATAKMQSLGLLQNNQKTLSAMKSLYNKLNSPVAGLNNLYLYTTFACNLRCTHCYADAGASNNMLQVAEILKTCQIAAKLGFRHAVILGGEPLVYQDRDKLLDQLSAIRQEVKPMLTVLRTNLAVEMNEALLKRIGYSTDEVVVSVDGNRETHDAIRGRGNYDVTISNLKALKKAGYNTNLSLASVLPMDQVNADPGNSVRELAAELNIKRVRFKPLLPLGRALKSNLQIIPETIWAYMDPHEMVEYGISPTSTCGIGQNLYVEPDGKAYPCYAWHGKKWYLGSIIEDGLESIVQSEPFLVTKKPQCKHKQKVLKM